MISELQDKLNPKKHFYKPESFLFSQFLDKWMSDVCKPNLAVRTYQDYENYIKDFIVPFLMKKGDFPIAEISPFHIQEIFEFIKKQNKIWALDKMKRILSSACNEACRWELLENNPVSKVKIPKIKRREPKILSADQIRLFLEKCDTAKYGLALELTLLTGLCPSETVGLRWKDIEFTKHFLNVRQSVTRVKGGGFVFKEPKSEKAKRRISLSEAFINKLRIHRSKQLELINYRKEKGYKWTNYDLVFPTRFGTPLMATNLNRRDLKDVLKAAGLPKTFSLYSLRHSIASLLLADGANVKDIQELLGHATATFTLDTYTHSVENAQKELSDRYSRILEVDNNDLIESDQVN